MLDCKSVPAEIRQRLFAVPVQAEFIDAADRELLAARLNALGN